MAGIPMRDGDEVIGALNIYSREPWDQASGHGVRRAGCLDRLTWPFVLGGRHLPSWMRHN
jgi:hypothetical protein